MKPPVTSGGLLSRKPPIAVQPPLQKPPVQQKPPVAQRKPPVSAGLSLNNVPNDVVSRKPPVSTGILSGVKPLPPYNASSQAAPATVQQQPASMQNQQKPAIPPANALPNVAQPRPPIQQPQQPIQQTQQDVAQPAPLAMPSPVAQNINLQPVTPYGRLSRMPPEQAVTGTTTVIPDGIALPSRASQDYIGVTTDVGSNLSPLDRNLQQGNLDRGDPNAVMQTMNNESLVENRLNNLLDSNGRYMQLARTGAQQQAASRGLLNSSIAAGAGENAAIRSALPIAQQDANTYAQMEANNNNIQNRFNENQQRQNFTTDRDFVNAGYQQDNMILNSQISEQQQARQQAYNIQNMDRAGFIQYQRDNMLQGFQTLNIDQNHRNSLEAIALNFANQQEQDRFKVGVAFQQQYLESANAMQANWSNEIQSIYSNGDMTQEQQARAVSEVTARYQRNVETMAAMYAEMGAWQVVVDQFPPADQPANNAGGGSTGGGSIIPPIDLGGGQGNGGNGGQAGGGGYNFYGNLNNRLGLGNP